MASMYMQPLRASARSRGAGGSDGFGWIGWISERAEACAGARERNAASEANGPAAGHPPPEAGRAA